MSEEQKEHAKDEKQLEELNAALEEEKKRSSHDEGVSFSGSSKSQMTVTFAFSDS